MGRRGKEVEEERWLCKSTEASLDDETDFRTWNRRKMKQRWAKIDLIARNVSKSGINMKVEQIETWW